MSKKYFGTDGIRGVANEKLTPELAFDIGQAAGRYLISKKLSRNVIVGRDTRRSGPMLGAALGAGFCSVGVNVTAAGVVPTPTVSYIVRNEDYGMGVVISASHNPAPDNGIKLFGHDGKKLPDEVEIEIESLMESKIEKRPVGEKVGYLASSRASVEAYLSYLVALVPERLEGMKVAVDAAHGAAYELAPEVLIRLGAEVFLTGAEPDGININEEGGASKPETIQEFTQSVGADVGVAFDGDADRAVFSDEKGALINGDRTLGLWSAHWRKFGGLEPAVVVGTVMSNGGFAKYMADQQIELVRAPVGDKYVAQKIAEYNAKVGGEQSGHIIFPACGPTGDGLVTMLQVLRVLKREGRPASAFSADYEPWPQLLVNVSVANKDTWKDPSAVQDALAKGEDILGQRGRLVVRASGTQPMVRVMVEADDYDLRDSVTDEIVNTLIEHSGGKIYSRVDLTHALGD